MFLLMRQNKKWSYDVKLTVSVRETLKKQGLYNIIRRVELTIAKKKWHSSKSKLSISRGFLGFDNLILTIKARPSGFYIRFYWWRGEPGKSINLITFYFINFMETCFLSLLTLQLAVIEYIKSEGLKQNTLQKRPFKSKLKHFIALFDKPTFVAPNTFVCNKWKCFFLNWVRTKFKNKKFVGPINICFKHILLQQMKI